MLCYCPGGMPFDSVQVTRVRHEKVADILRRSDAPGDEVMGDILVSFDCLESPLSKGIQYSVICCQMTRLWPKKTQKSDLVVLKGHNLAEWQTTEYYILLFDRGHSKLSNDTKMSPIISSHGTSGVSKMHGHGTLSSRTLMICNVLIPILNAFKKDETFSQHVKSVVHWARQNGAFGQKVD